MCVCVCVREREREREREISGRWGVWSSKLGTTKIVAKDKW